MNNLLLKEELSEKQVYMVQNQYEEKNKKTWIMWLIFAFIGGGGFHRMYIGDLGYGFAMLGVTIFISWATFGIATLVWLIVELFLIQKRLRFKNEEIEREIIRDVKIMTNK